MELYLTLLISLHVTISTRVASGQNPVSRSNVCKNTSSSTPCVKSHSLSCPANSSIFILEAVNGFLFSPSLQSICTGSVCDQQCCSLDNFLCTVPILNANFENYFANCWGFTKCTTPFFFDTRAFTGGNLNCSGMAALDSVSYQCIENSSVVRFDNETTVSGTAVVARYLKIETNSTSCLEPNNTLGCDVTMEGNGSTSDVRVMLVIEHSAYGGICSMLSIADHSFSTGNQSCKQNFVAYAVKNITMSGNTNYLSIVLTLLEAKHPIKAWAVVTSSTTTLQMQCGRGTCKPSADNSTLPDNSTSMDNSTTTKITSGSTVVSNGFTTSPFPSNDRASDPPASKTTTSTITTTGQAFGNSLPVAAIAGGTVGGIIVIALIIAIIVVCYRCRSSSKELSSSVDGEVNPIAPDDVKLEPVSRALHTDRPPSAYEDVDDPDPGHRKTNYSSILLEEEAPVPSPSPPPPDDSESDYDHLRQRRPTPKVNSGVVYGYLGEVEEEADPDYSYDRLGCSVKKGKADLETPLDSTYSRLDAVQRTPEASPDGQSDSTDDVNADGVTKEDTFESEARV